MVLFEGTHFQQNDIADDRVKNLGVIERLVGIVDRLGVDSRSVFGVVFDFDRQIAADGFHENAIIDRDMRMFTITVQLAMGSNPFEVVLRRELNFVIAAVIDVLERSLR